MNDIMIFIPGCVVFVFLITFLAFQMLKEDKGQQFILILKSSRLLLVISVLTAIIISVLCYHFFGMGSVPIIWFTVLLSLILPVLISAFRYTLGKK